MKAFKNKSEDFKLNASPYRQPVETTITRFDNEYDDDEHLIIGTNK